MTAHDHARAVKSFVIRAGRMTSAQQGALTDLLPRYSMTTEARTGERAYGFLMPAPLSLEIGIGNGDNVLAMAGRDPATNFLASDVHRPGIGHLLLGIERLALSNLRVHCGDVVDLLQALPDGSLSSVHVYFPDPWPKKRHHKRRLVNPPTLGLLGHRMRRGARLYFATDHADYAEAVRALLDANPGWTNLAGPGCWAVRPGHRIVTRFEQRARRAGTVVYELACARR